MMLEIPLSRIDCAKITKLSALGDKLLSDIAGTVYLEELIANCGYEDTSDFDSVDAIRLVFNGEEPQLVINYTYRPMYSKIQKAGRFTVWCNDYYIIKGASV